MHSKVILPVLLGILIIGITQFAFAEELEKVSFIAVDEEKFEQPQSRYNYHEITIIGYIEDYTRGAKVIITITNPDGTEDELRTIASKKGNLYTLLHITNDSQIGIHQLTLTFHDEVKASTTFEILENK